MNYAKKVFPLLLALIAIAGLAACGNSDDSSTESAKAGGSASTKNSSPRPSATTTIVVRNGEPVGGVQKLDYSAGEEVRFTVRSNAADEVHVHGYDVEKEIPAGGSATLSFPADIEGIFEVELHGSETQIAELRVNP
jgi:hypothetical protein